MRFLRFLSVLGLAFLAPTLSHADWQYTRWGMTPTEVIAASSGSVSEYTPPPPKPIEGRGAIFDQMRAEAAMKPSPKVQGPYNAGNLSFKVTFYFDKSDKLVQVRLDLENALLKADDLYAALTQTYGEGINLAPPRSPDRNVAWNDSKQKNRVEFYSVNRPGNRGGWLV